ncbi:hypothetical protein C7E18_24630, partial [Stenotrophomonas maltophilia]
AWRLALRKAGLRLRWDAMLLRVPMVGRFVLGVKVAWRLALRKAGLRLRWDAMLLRVPMVGRFVLGV